MRRRRRSDLRVCVTDHLGRRLSHRTLAGWLARVAPAGAGEVTIALVSDARMRALNRRFRGIDRVTDVLSFPVAGPAVALNRPAGQGGRRPGATCRTGGHPRDLGDIVIATGRAARQARDVGHPVQIELQILALHGLLHLLGHDHVRDGGRMAKAEQRYRRRGGLVAGLIERASTVRPARVRRRRAAR